MMFAMHSAAFCLSALCVLQVLHAQNRQTMKKGEEFFCPGKKVVDVVVSVETIEVSSTGFGHRLAQEKRNDSADYHLMELSQESTKAAYLPCKIELVSFTFLTVIILALDCFLSQAFFGRFSGFGG